MNPNRPAALVDLEWLDRQPSASSVRLLDLASRATFKQAHLPNAIAVDWSTAEDPRIRDIVSAERFAEIMGSHGVTERDTIVLCDEPGSNTAANVYWICRYYGHSDVCLLDGGRAVWKRDGWRLTDETHAVTGATYAIPSQANDRIRLMLMEVMASLNDDSVVFVDGRSLDEYRGHVDTTAGVAVSGHRGGHLPGAVHFPTTSLREDDGTFVDRDRVLEFCSRAGIDTGKTLAVYSGGAKRSSALWFALHELAGFADVRNYDGGWAEYGSIIGAPIEK